MPKCIVANCKNTTHKSTSRGITMHVFPHNLQRIKHWLLKIGQNFGNLDAFAQRILEAKKTDAFRICSDHFTPESYITQGCRSILRTEAVPTLFPKQREFSSEDEAVPPPPKRFRSGAPSQDYDTLLKAYNRTRQEDKGILAAVECKDVSTRTDIYYKSRDAGTRTNPFQGVKNKKISTDPKIGRKHASTITSAWKMDISTNNPVEMVDASTNTEPIPGHHFEAESWKIGHDHVYLRASTPDKPICFNLQPSLDSSGSNCVSDDGLNQISSVYSKDKMDADQLVHERKFLVFESCLDELLQKLTCTHSDGCRSAIAGFEKHISGTMLTVIGRCYNDHTSCLWQSQPMKGRTCMGDLIGTAAVLFSGSNIKKVDEMFRFMGVPFVSPKRYAVLQKKYLFPVVDLHWLNEQQQSRDFFLGHPICLVGDSQSGIFGKGGRFCAYTFLESTTKKVLNVHVVHSANQKSPMTMENLAYKNCLDNLLDEGLTIETVCTAKHHNLQCTMEEQYNSISHKYDIWEYCKSFRKKLTAASRKIGCAKIAKWIPELTNHLHYSTCSASNQVQLVHQKWLSYLYHITGQHSWDDFREFGACAHRPLTPEETEQWPWLTQNSPAYQQVRGILTNKSLLDDLDNIAMFFHKGQTALLHSFMLKYRQERLHFELETLEARMKLAALAYNNSTQRTCVAMRYHSLCRGGFSASQQPKNVHRNNWAARYIYSPFASAHIFPMISDTIRFANKQLFHSWTGPQMSTCLT
ncbi:uncharacterized protein [Pyxicephalus adspersus]|uniref:uncharacterized protein n=1 Tax=Pyxicephalus adspersus TaxID=30357 RepID=UPI003B5B70F9